MLAGSRYYVSLYLLIGYHQVEIALEGRYETTIVTHYYLLIYYVMPFW